MFNELLPQNENEDGLQRAWVAKRECVPASRDAQFFLHALGPSTQSGSAEHQPPCSIDVQNVCLTPDLSSKNLHFNKSPRGFVFQLKL